MTGHGGNIYEIERNLKIPKDSIVDFSSNVNPLGPDKRFLRLMKNQSYIASRYPDIEYHDLKEAISSFYKINSGQLIAGNGATEILSLFFRALQPKKALILSPTFSEYERSLLNAGTAIKHFKLDEDRGFMPNMEMLSAELKNNYDLAVMCNPNNPTGHIFNSEFTVRLLEETGKHGTRLFIDESFMDFALDADVQSSFGFIDKHPNLFILKSLTKIFAIPGLRLGFGACSDSRIIDKMKTLQDPWSINCFADLAGRVLLHDKKYIDDTKKYVDCGKIIFLQKLSRIKNLRIFGSQCNFLLVKIIYGLKSNELQKLMLDDKILIRDCSNFKFLSDEYFRIAVKSRKDNMFFMKSLSRRINPEENL